MPVRNPRRSRSALRLEPLESRDAPATLVSPTRVTYQDADGDTVAVTFSKPFLTAANAVDVFTFDTGTVDGSNATRQQLRSINLNGEPAAAGTGVTVRAVRSAVNGGDGRAAVGEVIATGIDLATVVIDGDLGRLSAGDSTGATTALGSLKVHSVGRYGTTTGAADLHTLVFGPLGFLRVKADVREANIDVQGVQTDADARMGSVVVGGSLLGGAADQSGRIRSAGSMGPVRVAGDVVGGAGASSGQIDGQLTLARVTIGGSLVGGGGAESGEIICGRLVAGAAVGGAVAGGTGIGSGRIVTFDALGPVRVGGDVAGGSGESSGQVQGFGPMPRLVVGGSVLGGAGTDSGYVQVLGSVGRVRVAGDVAGGNGFQSGLLATGDVGRLAVGGSVLGGPNQLSGIIVSDGTLRAVRVAGSVVGGSAAGTFDLIQTGYILAQRIGTLTIGGSLVAGTNATTGAFANNGAVQALDDIGSILIRGSIVGNPTSAAVITARGQAAPTGTSDLAIGRLRVLGRVEFARIRAGVEVSEFPMNADAQIGPVSVGGDWVASSLAAGADPTNAFFGDADDAKLTGVKDDPLVFSRVARVTIGGQVLGTVGGADHYGIVAEVVGAVTVGGSAFPTTPGAGNDDFPVGITGDFRVNEI